jgi:3'-5' exoribonuclease 1
MSHSRGMFRRGSSRHSAPAVSKDTPFDYLLVVDFEATCVEHGAYFQNEIIEFPCVVIDVKAQQIVHSWRKYVRPVRHPTLSAFCTQLTGIQQEQVDAADPLPQVLKDFEEWFLQVIPPNSKVIFATDGPWDLRNFFYQQAVRRDKVTASTLFHAWVDIRTTYYKWKRLDRPLKLEKMLEAMKLEFEGRQHSGLDDATNIARLAIEMLKRGCGFNHVCSTPFTSRTYTFPPWVTDEEAKKLQRLIADRDNTWGRWLLVALFLLSLFTTAVALWEYFS